MAINQRKFFDTFALSKKFNPLDAAKWYSVTRKDIIQRPVSAHLNLSWNNIISIIRDNVLNNNSFIYILYIFQLFIMDIKCTAYILNIVVQDILKDYILNIVEDNIIAEYAENIPDNT